MTFTAQSNKGSMDLTEYTSMDDAIAHVAAVAKIGRIDRPRDGFAMVWCAGGTIYTIKAAAPVAAPTKTARPLRWSKHVAHCAMHHEGDTDMPSQFANR